MGRRTLADRSRSVSKVCDGRVWRELAGEIKVEERGSGVEIRLGLSGRTKPMIPEFTIKAPLEDQIFEMSDALQELVFDL